MGQLRYTVGEKVLASRSEDGHDHEQATVVDAYELLINLAPRPMVVVDFADGERRWLTASEPFVLPLAHGAESEPDEEAEGAEADGAELEVDAVGVIEGVEPAGNAEDAEAPA